LAVTIRGFINSSRKAASFHRQVKIFELNFFIRTTFHRLSNQTDKIVLIAGQFAWCLALTETPGYHDAFKTEIL